MSSALSRKQNIALNVVVCVGAAIVIVGALFKIMHWPGSDIFLPVGLITEAVIFIVYAFVPPDEDHAPETGKDAGSNTGLNPIKAMNEILLPNMNKLSDNFKVLGTTVEQMSKISEVVKTTGDYTKNTKDAADAMLAVKNATTNAATAMGSLNSATESTKQFHDQIQVLTKNLGSLNTVYELELQESNNHLKVMNQFYGKLAEASAAMQGSAEDAKRAQAQIAELANNLTKLNSIYGNMLTAMRGQ